MLSYTTLVLTNGEIEDQVENKDLFAVSQSKLHKYSMSKHKECYLKSH